VQGQIGALAAALPDSSAADALTALGFGTVLLEKKQLLAPERKRIYDAIRAQTATGRRLEQLRETPQFISYRLTSPVPVRRDFAMLEDRSSGTTEEGELIQVAGTPVEFAFRNASNETFRHPDPIAPSDLLARWARETGETVLEQRIRALLPIALGPGSTIGITLALTQLPAPGRYVVRISREQSPDAVLARRSMRVSERLPTAR
jgi:hypothetical protein